jgi:hypothetical protein
VTVADFQILEMPDVFGWALLRKPGGAFYYVRYSADGAPQNAHELDHAPTAAERVEYLQRALGLKQPISTVAKA